MENKKKKNDVKIKENKKAKSKKISKKSKANNVEQPIEKEYYFGHNENDDIFDCFLTNKMFAHSGLLDK